MRIFTAIPVPKSARDAFQEGSRGRLPIPYINTGNFHVTLCHLGELETDQANRVIREWNSGLPELQKFPVELERVDKLNHHLVIYLKPNDHLMAVYSALEKRFRDMGFKLPAREFKPHITLGKMHLDNVMFRWRKVEDFPQEALASANFTADSIVLYESKMLLHHPNYIILSEQPLK